MDSAMAEVGGLGPFRVIWTEAARLDLYNALLDDPTRGRNLEWVLETKRACIDEAQQLFSTFPDRHRRGRVRGRACRLAELEAYPVTIAGEVNRGKFIVTMVAARHSRGRYPPNAPWGDWARERKAPYLANPPAVGVAPAI